MSGRSDALPMRAFVLLGHTQPLDPGFPLDDLPGGAGRLDVLCRNLTAALLLSHDIRRDVTVWMVVRDALTIEVRGDEVRHLRPDERSTAALIRRALETAADRAVSARPVESTPGVYVRRQGLAGTLEALAADHALVDLHPDGEPLTPEAAPTDPAFVLSDHRPPTDEERSLLAANGAVRRSIGPRVVHGDQAIAVAHNVMDRAGGPRHSGTGTG